MKMAWNKGCGHKRAGFTLVELVVVIAILGILAGVGTVAYSGYVEKANKQVDISLAGDIEHALLLAGYSGTLADGSSVVVSNNGVTVAGTGADEAMKAAFGDEYASALKLNWNGWADENGVAGNATMMGYVNSSTFGTDEETLGNLLDDVQMVVGILTGALSGGGVSISANSDLGQFLTANGIEISSSNAQAISNATVMHVANNMTTALSGDEEKGSFANAWYEAIGSGNIVIPTFSSGDAYANLSSQFAFVEGLAGHIDAATGTTTYKSQLSNARNGGNGTGVLNELNNVVAGINNAIRNGETATANAVISYFGIQMNSEGGLRELTDAEKKETKAYKNGMAFLAYMQGISSATDSLIGGTDLSNANYYNDGTVLNYVTNFVTLSDLLTAAGASGNSMAFVYSSGNVICMPLDY